MKNYIVFNIQTGDIIRYGQCPDSMLEIQAVHANEDVMEGIANDKKNVIDLDKLEVADKSKEILDIEKGKEDELLANKVEEKLIEEKMNEIIRKMAIDELTKEGKIK